MANSIIVKDKLSSKLRSIRLALKAYPEELKDQLVELTPKNRGNAKNSTEMQGQYQIHANYPYAQVLDEGRRRVNGRTQGSNQAPKGMTKPLRKWAEKHLKQIVKTGR